MKVKIFGLCDHLLSNQTISFEFLWVFEFEFEYFANFEKDNIKKKLFFWVWIWVSIFSFFLIIKIDTPINTQKINFFFILNYLFRNLQEIWKILKLKLKTQMLKKLKTQTET